jgi:hypothetical protein
MTLGAAGHDPTLLTVSESPALDALEADWVRGMPFRHVTVGRNPGALANFARRVRGRLALQATAAGFETLHALGAVEPLRAAARALPADLTIVHNEIPHWIGCDLLKAGRKVAADFEDWHTEDLMPVDRRGRPLGAMREIERTLLQRAAYVSTTSAALSAALAQRYAARPPAVITNSFPLQPDPRSGPLGRPPAFFWFSQTIGPGLLGHVRPGYDSQLLGLLPESFRARVSFLPLVPPAALPGVIARHDIGLALEQPAIVNRDLTITNKILQYLNAGLAVIASDTAGQREVLAHAPDAGLLLAAGGPAALGAQLDGLLADHRRLEKMAAAARRAAETRYSWEIEAPRLCALVDAALAAAT